MKKLLLAFALLLSLFVVASCGGECSKDSDCEQRQCFSAVCSAKKCVYEPIANCCGNRIKEAVEDGKPGNECTCQQDYGSCYGTSGKYLLKQCSRDNTECTFSIRKDVQKVSSLTYRKASAGINFRLTSTFNMPFNIDKDTFKLDIGADSIDSKLSEIMITKLSLSAMDKSRREILLGEKEVGKSLWDTATTVSDEMILTFLTEEKEETLSSLSLVVSFEYLSESAGARQRKDGSVKFDFGRLDFAYANPTADKACPESCDDNNEGTADSCSQRTNYFCVHVPIPGKCGNFRCEAEEDKCTCPADCGRCSGTIGEFLEYACLDNRCVAEFKANAVQADRIVVEEKSIGKIKLNVKYSYKRPFDINSDQFTIEFELLNQDASVRSPMVRKIMVLDGSNLLGELQADLALSGTPASSSVPAAFSMTKPDEKRGITIKVYYEYTDTELRTGSFQRSLGDVSFVRTG